MTKSAVNVTELLEKQLGSVYFIFDRVKSNRKNNNYKKMERCSASLSLNQCLF